MLYRLRYAWRLYRRASGMTLLEALLYPPPPRDVRGDPVADADAELSYWVYDLC